MVDHRDRTMAKATKDPGRAPAKRPLDGGRVRIAASKLTAKRTPSIKARIKPSIKASIKPGIKAAAKSQAKGSSDPVREDSVSRAIVSGLSADESRRRALRALAGGIVLSGRPDRARSNPKPSSEADAAAAAVRFKAETWGAALAEVQAAVAASSGVAVSKHAADRLSVRARTLLRGIEIQEADLVKSGGAYELGEVEALLRVTRQRVHQLVQQGDVLAVPGPGNRARYPSVQFHVDPRYGRAVPVAGIGAVREALGTGNPWMVLNFLVNPAPRLGGERPIDLLYAGKAEQVLPAAAAFGDMGS